MTFCSVLLIGAKCDIVQIPAPLGRMHLEDMHCRGLRGPLQMKHDLPAAGCMYLTFTSEQRVGITRFTVAL